jgi:acyl-CoA thioester hydrolase
MPYEFEITRFVEFSETDAAGIMHFSNFFRFMESAEHAFFRSLGLSLAHRRNGLEIGLPRVHAECDYALPLRVEDEVRVRLLVERVGRSSVTYQFRFNRVNGSSLQEVARGRVIAAFVKRGPNGAFKSVPLPKAIADRIDQAPAHLLSGGGPSPAKTTSVPIAPARKRTRRLPNGLRQDGGRTRTALALPRQRGGAGAGADHTLLPNPGPEAGIPHRHD